MTTTPRIAITMGDVNGIGPEVTAAAVCDDRVTACCLPVVVGSVETMQRALATAGLKRGVRALPALDAPINDTDDVLCWEPPGLPSPVVRTGQVSAEAGQFAHDGLRAAAAEALRGTVDAISTAPLNKAALDAAGIRFPGHTEILADACDVDEFAMMLFVAASTLAPIRAAIGEVSGVEGQGLAIAHVTLHTALASVPALLTADAILEKTQLVFAFLQQLGIDAPRIGICSLNPHGGEGGLFGDEEARLIAPAVGRAREMGIDASGPFPADTLVRRGVAGEFHGLVAMYHDQGHIPIKLIAFDTAVNVTLGLPIIRTSPTHGTAFDIAGTGRADGSGMVQAITLAAQLATRRRR